MEVVCPDLDNVSTWYYSKHTQKYMRMLPSGDLDKVKGQRMIARLHGRDIPNPDLLWQNRCEARGVATTSINGMKLKPTSVTYALWAHWQEARNA